MNTEIAVTNLETLGNPTRLVGFTPPTALIPIRLCWVCV